MKPTVDTLVLDSGGVKGLYILGSLKKLEEEDILKNINLYIGTSVGSIICFFLIIGLSITDIIKIVSQDNFKDIMTDNFLKIPFNLLLKYGLYTGNNFIKFLKKLLKEKGFNQNITFTELFSKTNKTFTCVSTSLSSKDVYFFNHHTTPNLQVVNAIRMSIGIPLFYTMCNYNNECMVDGGVLMPYPFYYYNLCTIHNKYLFKYSEIDYGISIDINSSLLHMDNVIGIILLEANKKSPKPPTIINSFSKFIIEFVNTTLQYIDFENHKHPLLNTTFNFWKQSIFIEPPSNIDNSAISFNISLEQKTEMINYGYSCATNYLLTTGE